MKKLLLLLPTILLVFMPNSTKAKTYVIKGVSYPEPEAIDLGLPSGNKWANMNIGASSVNEIGGYYGWADPTGELTVDDYFWRCTTLDGTWTSPLFGGTNPPRDISGSELDIATNKLGAEWCMPSSDDFKELTDNCSFVVESQFVRVTGPNGNSIILPISGMWIWSHQGGGQDASRWKYMQEMTSYPCFWVSTRSFYNHGDSEYWAQYNQPAADYAHADANGFWGADGTCDSWYRNGMIPIRAIKRGKNDAGYVEVCGIKWAKGNLQYDEVNGGDENFMTNWRLAPYQWHYYNYADGYGQQTYDQWDDQIDHFNWGVCGSNALSIYDYAKIGNARIFTGKMYTDEACTNECTDFSMAKYGDIAYWASKGVYRTPTMEEYHTIGDNASISFGYCVSPDNKKVYGCLFTTPNGERIIETQEREFTSEDLNKGLFLPFNATRLNPQATAGHNGKLIYFGSEGSYWSSETDGGGNSNVGARGFCIQNWALEEGMDDGVHTLATYCWGQACQGAPIRPILVNQNQNVTYKLTYIVDGVAYNTYEVEFGTTLTPEPTPTKEGYTFSGWSEIPETMPALDVKITGSFTVNTYKLSYFVDGQPVLTTGVNYGDQITPLEEPTKEGYTFSGWSEIPETMPAHDVTVTGTFTINQYTIKFVVDGEEVASKTQDYQTAVTAPEIPEREGYTFVWENLPETVPAYDVIVTGTFTTNTYKLSYFVDNQLMQTIDVNYNSPIVPLEGPTKEGYTFSGWSEIPGTMPAHDVTVTGSFTINHYTVTFKVGENVYETRTLDYGSTIIAPEMPELTGYTFTWGEVPATMPAQDVTIVGDYQPNLYNITYLINGQFFAIFKVAYGSTITPPDAPEREGSTFTWGEYPETMPAHDITIEGTYTDGIDLVQGVQNTEIYTVDGKKVNRMQKGVNIVNGKKVIIR